jgi:hypothetical protein
MMVTIKKFMSNIGGILNFMKKKRRISFLALCVATILVFSLTAYGQSEEEHIHGTAIRTEQEFLQMQNGGSYYLENDLDVSETVTVSGEISLCLNGKVLKYQNTEKTGSIFRVQNNGVLNIYDCSEETHTCEVSEDGLWKLSDETEKDDLKTVVGGLIIGGTGEKMLSPKKEASRAEIATVLYRLQNK